MNTITSLGSSSTGGESRLLQETGFLNAANSQPTGADLEVKEKFQEFVAGTFYSLMLKSLHKTHDKPAYFHGGQAEELFQSQMDQQVASDLAQNHGSQFSDSLFDAFLRR